ncbi:ribonuclease H-like domain-containing protein [Tanacetum coccineum]
MIYDIPHIDMVLSYTLKASFYPKEICFRSFRHGTYGVDTESNLGSDGDLVYDPMLHRSLEGGLQYPTFTHPDLSYVVQHARLQMHDPQEPHFAALKRALCYVRGTLDLGLQLYASSIGSIIAYYDVDWVGCPNIRCSTSSYYVFLGDNLLSCSSKR